MTRSPLPAEALERLYTPYVVSDARRRMKAPLHFAHVGEYRTRCGVRTDNMDSGCLDDMDAQEVLAQKETCIRCVQAISRASMKGSTE